MKDMETEKSHDSFLEKIGGKISVVTRDGSLVAANQDHSMHFVKPLKQRHLPIVAMKYKAKTPILNVQQSRGHTTTRIPIIPSAAASTNQDNTTPINILMKKKISENSKAKKLAENAIVIPNTNFLRDITKIPTVKRTFSINGEDEEPIFNLEQRGEERSRNIKDVNQLESQVLKKMSEWPSWGSSMMRDLSRIIEPLYAADMLKDSIKNIGDHGRKKETYHEEKSLVNASNAGKGDKEYDFSTKSYDDHVTIPSAGLFFAVIDTNRSLKKSRENISSLSQTSRAGSTYSEIYKTKSGRSSIISAKSQSVLSNQKLEKEDEITTTSYYPIEKAAYDDIPKYTDFNESLNNHPDIEEAIIDLESINEKEHEKEKNNIQTEDKSYLLPNESDMSRSATSRSSSASGSKNQSQKKFKPSYFPPADVKLGGLGPDKDSDTYLSKLEKVRKQKEYADNIRKLSQMQRAKKVNNASPAPKILAPIIYEKQLSAIPRLPKINLKTITCESLSDAALTKHQKMKLYANKVKRPAIASSKSLPELKTLPAIDRYRNVSAPNLPSSPTYNLMKLEEKHNQDLKAVEEIRRYYQ